MKDFSNKTYAELLREEEHLEEQYENISRQCVEEGLKYDEFCERAYDVKESLYFISKEIRLKKDPTMEFGKHWQGDTYTLSKFIEMVKSGGFIDSDGYGYYATDNGKSDITIIPSDIMENKYREDFTHIIWFNR
jgi:hypothetical protein